MQNPYLIRTATIVSLAAALVGAGWMGLQGDEMQLEPGAIAVAGAHAEPGHYFPAEFTLQPNPDEPAVYEFY
jgi:hypothetical protein